MAAFGLAAAISLVSAMAAPVLTVESPGALPAQPPSQGLLRPPDALLQQQIPSLKPQPPVIPAVSKPSSEITFSKDPTDVELIVSRCLEVRLAPRAGAVIPGENAALAAQLLKFKGNPADTGPLEEFLRSYPNTRWRASLLLNLGLACRNQARWTRVIPIWQEAWDLSKNDTSDLMRLVGDRALGELLNIHARLGHLEALQALLTETKDRKVQGPGRSLVIGAKEGLGTMLSYPGEGYRCGPLALAQIYRIKFPGAPRPASIDSYKSTADGTNLEQVRRWAKELNLDYQVAYRNPGADVIVPSVIHWKVGHFAALTKGSAGGYVSQDYTFGMNNVVSKDVLDLEASGYFLVPAGGLPAGWHQVPDEEAKGVFGKGNADNDAPLPPDDDAPSCGGDCNGAGGTNPNPVSSGMTTYKFQPTTASLSLTDTPEGYVPPIGFPIVLTVDYSSREPSDQNSVSNFGLGWTSKWISYLYIAQNQPSGTILCFGPGGGELEFFGYNPANGQYTPQLLSHDVLVQVTPSSFVLNHQDGSRDIYSLSDGSTTPSIFRTYSIDRFGNAVSYGYDAYYRLSTITDAVGQVTVLQYGLTSNSASTDFYRITRVTDPFGRAASFTYSYGLLTSITDVLGIKSQFGYSLESTVSSLTTPYGTTTFTTYGDGVHTIGLQAEDPLGGKERVEWDMAVSVPVADIVDPVTYAAPAAVVPSNFTNANLVYRNSFYWDKKAMMEAPGDYNKAFIYHWLHDAASGNISTGYVIESTKSPLENRAWREYPGQAYSLVEGTSNQPSRIARILDDGTEQDYYTQYNYLGNITQTTDPQGRTTTLNYYPNGMDVQNVMVQNGTKQDLLASYTYNNQHLPLTATDASGETTSFTYNGFGEVLSITNARNETTTFSYDAHGYLLSMHGPLGNALTSYSYDGYGRVQTVTNPEGYALTAIYDAANRPLKLTFPDGTFSQVIYNRLEAQWTQDRLGRWTYTDYDAMQHLVLSQDPLLRKTLYERCTCGALISITDPNGNRTAFNRDLQNRLTQKVFADGTSINLTYENTTSRLKSETDAKGQTKTFAYNLDNTISGITYSNSAVSTANVAYSYDPAYLRRTAMADGVGTTVYGYYPITGSLMPGAGRLATVSGPLPSSVASYSYDELGRVVGKAINGSANSSSIVFDGSGRISNVTNPLGQFAYQYNTNTALLQAIQYPNGQAVKFNYYGNAAQDGSGNGDQRLQEIENLSPSGANISSFTYTYDLNGELTTWGKQWGSGATLNSSYSYDGTSQLLSAIVPNPVTQAPQNFFYTYDLSGNRTQEQVDSNINTSSINNVNELEGEAGGGTMAFAGAVSEPATVTIGNNVALVDSLNNWHGFAPVLPGANAIPLTAVDSQGNSTSRTIHVTVSSGANQMLTYDLNGNLTNNGAGQAYSWDAENRLVSIVQANGVTGFVYDGSGNRVQETLNGTVIKQWVWCGAQLAEERDASGNVTKRFYAQGQQMGGVPYFYSRDHMGSIREMTDASGAIRAQYEYDPYGRSTKLSGDLDADFGFAGYYVHAATGLNITLFREYDPNLGRWLSRDPLGEAGGLDLYGYVGNNPVLETDPSGLCICDDLNAQLVTANAILKENQAYFGPNGQFATTTAYTADTDPANDFVGAVGAVAGVRTYMVSKSSPVVLAAYGAEMKSVPVIATGVGTSTAIVGAYSDVKNLITNENGNGAISNGAAVLLDAAGQIPGVGLVASIGQAATSIGLDAYQTYENGVDRTNMSIDAAAAQNVIDTAKISIQRLQNTKALNNCP